MKDHLLSHGEVNARRHTKMVNTVTVILHAVDATLDGAMETFVQWLFRKKQAQSERLPPTQGALRPAVLRAHYQAMVWNNDVVADPDMPSPENYGWEKNDNRWLPVITKLPPAPEAIIQLVKCGCKKQCVSNRCQCRRNGLPCTDLCSCSDEEGEPCQNFVSKVVVS